MDSHETLNNPDFVFHNYYYPNGDSTKPQTYDIILISLDQIVGALKSKGYKVIQEVPFDQMEGL